MKVTFFGKLGDAIAREVKIDSPKQGCTVRELRAHLATRFPHAQADLLGPRLRACVNDEIVPDDHQILPEADIAFFPPLSGG